MSDKESKQSNIETPAKDAQSHRDSISKISPISDIQYLNADVAHNTYAKLICREDEKSHKRSMTFLNQELKDISQLKPSKKGLTTYELEQKKANLGKKNFGVQKDLVKKNLDGSIGDDLQKNKYKYGKRRFDYLKIMDDYSKHIKKENTFKCETSKNQTSARIKKLNDQYKVNPIEILDKDKTKEMNDTNRKKVINKTKAFSDYMGSKRTEHLFKSYQTAPVFVDKITNNPSNILKKSIMENRKTQPMFSRYKFRHYLVGKNKAQYVQ